MKQNLNLMIATPAYGCQLHTDYFNSMIALQKGALQAGINVEFMTIGNQSLVPKARNSLISDFYHNKQFSHIIFIDADMGIPTQCIPSILKRDVDVIGVPVPLKGYNPDGSPVLNIGELLDISDDLLAETTHVGNAVLMLSRKAVDALIEISEPYHHDHNYSRGDQLSNVHYDVFKIGVTNGKYIGIDKNVYLPEDYYLCNSLKKLGFKIHLDLSVPVRHNGMHGFVHSEQHLVDLVNKYKNEKNNFWNKISKKEEI